MTDEIKFKVLMEYVEFSTKLMLAKSAITDDEKKKNDYFIAAASLYTVVQIGKDDNNLLEAVAEMARPESKIYHDLPIPFEAPKE